MLLTLPAWKKSRHQSALPLLLPNHFPQHHPLKLLFTKRNSIHYLFSVPLYVSTHITHQPFSMALTRILSSSCAAVSSRIRMPEWELPGWVFHTHIFNCQSSKNSSFDLPLAAHWHDRTLTFNCASFLRCQISVKKKLEKNFLRYKSNGTNYKGENVYT